MKRAHFVILFFLLFVILFTNVMVKERKYNIVKKERRAIENAFLNAANDAVEKFPYEINDDIDSSLIEISNAFFSSLSANLNLYNEFYEETEESLHVPLLLITTDDGFYLCVLRPIDTSEGKILQRCWTECIPYQYTDNAFVYRLSMNGKVTAYHKANKTITETTYNEIENNEGLKLLFSEGDLFTSKERYEEVLRSTMIKSIEEHVSSTLATQSFIAGEYGLNISYTTPSFLSVLSPDTYNTFIAIYQGLPSAAGIGNKYSGIKTAAYIQEKPLYYISEPQNEKYYRTAHRMNCPSITGTEIGPVDKENAVHTYGAYGCPDCTSYVDGFAEPPGT